MWYVFDENKEYWEIKVDEEKYLNDLITISKMSSTSHTKKY